MTTRVLIADNDPDILDLISALLNEEGFETIAFTDGLAALHAIQTERPTLAIIDLALPVIDGPELIQRLRQELGEYLPVIAISAAIYTPPQDLLQADAYVSKPFDLEELLDHVKALASRKNAPDGQSVEAQPSLLPLKHSIPGIH
jgi:two-component system OmpR family response regulator